MNDQIARSSDADLVEAALRGSRDAFAGLVERHQRLVCAVAYARTGSVAAAEDVAQEAFVAAWKNLARLRDVENFRGWICGTARNLAARFYRGERPAEPLTEEMVDANLASPREETMSREEEGLLWAALLRLPVNLREPLVLFYRGGQSVHEIAGELSVSEDVVRQRLSRGRARLQEAVRAKVESALTRSRPGAAFTMAVLAAVPALTSSAQAAGVGLAMAKGSGVLGTSLGLMLVGPIIGLVGGWFGFSCALNGAETERERRFIRRVGWGTLATTVPFMGALFALIAWGRTIQAAWPKLWIVLIAATILTYCAGMLLFAFLNHRTQERIRAEERRNRGAAVGDPRCILYEYRSRLRFLGLPLIHLRLGGSVTSAARGWIAFGNVAVAPLLAVGGVAIGGISLGAISVGLLTTGALGIGLFSFSGLAAGGVAIGGVAIGWIAMGGAAWGGLAAFGGEAWAGVYGLGRHVVAPHANDGVARAFFLEHGLLQIMAWLVNYGAWVQMAIFAPMAFLICRLRKLPRPAAKIVAFLLLPLFLLSCSPKMGEQDRMDVKTVPATLFFCIAREGTPAEIPRLAERAVGPLYETLGRLGQTPAGNLQFICPQWNGPDAASKIVFAIPVAKEFPVDGTHYFWTAPAFRCASVEYRGAMSGIKDAWMNFAGAVEANGHKPAGSWREIYAHWVAPESAENRTELQMGIR